MHVVSTNPHRYVIVVAWPIICLMAAMNISLAQTADDIQIKREWIPMPDGVRLAADIYLPAKISPDQKLPVLLEYLPYRKEEGRSARFGLFAYFVRHGYAVARVDIRGTGSSEGKLVAYEYTEEEQRDGESVIAWLSERSYANGNVGMFGISWGGFNSIHLAMRKPTALKAIIALMATDDIYEDDVHFMDGMMHIDAYEIGQDIANILPGAPEFKIDREYFSNRFETKPWLLTYKEHQRDGVFWDRASLQADYSRLSIPAFLIGGWYDGYRDSAPRMLANVKAPMKAMIGPWNHTFPNWADPPPAVEWRKEAVRWFDHWLKGIDTGIMNEPRFAVFMRDWHAPGTDLKSIPGQWHWLNEWPMKDHHRSDTFFLGGARSLARIVRAEESQTLKYIPSAGTAAGGSVMWWGDWAPDQAADDSSCLVYETPVLTEDVQVLGFPLVSLNVSSSAPHADWFARLNDVAPSGTVTLVTGAGINGTHRISASAPAWLQPGKLFTLPIEMHFTSWTFRKGHRIRLAVNNAMWPMIWPVALPLTTTVTLGGKNPSQLVLPVVTLNNNDAPVFSPPEDDPKLPGYQSLTLGTNSGFAEAASVKRDKKNNAAQVTLANAGADQYPWGKVSYTELIVHETHDDDPAHTSVNSVYTIKVELKDRVLEWKTDLNFSSDKKNFYYRYTRWLYEQEKLIRKKSWRKTIKRDFQ